jgi:cysteine desulfurase
VIAQLRDKLENLLREQISELVVNGDVQNRLAGNLHICIPNIANTAIIARIRDKLAISTGSACTSGTLSPSHVLQAMSLSEEMMEGSLRIGMGKFTTINDIKKASNLIINCINDLKKYLNKVY